MSGLSSNRVGFHNLHRGHAIMARSTRHREYVSGSKSLVHAVLDPGVAAFPGVLFKLHNERLKVLPGSLTQGVMPVLRETFFTPHGKVEALGPGLQCVMALLHYNLAFPTHCLNKLWHAKVHMVEGLPQSSPDVVRHAWKDGMALAPPQIAIMDAFLPNTDIQRKRAAGQCFSVGHVGGGNVPIHAASQLVHGKTMCIVCYNRNLKGVSANPVVTQFRPWSAREIVQNASPAVQKSTRKILASCVRVFLLSQLDAHSRIALTDVTAHAIHGTSVALHPLHYRSVYILKPNTYNIMEGKPGVAFGLHALMNGNQHPDTCRQWFHKLRACLHEHTVELDNYGRVTDMPHSKWVVAKPYHLMPHVTMAQAQKTGIQPWHQFVSYNGGTLWLSRALVIVRRHLEAGTLKIRIKLVPPIDNVLVNPREKTASVRELPHAQVLDMDKKLVYPVFVDGEWVTYAWLAHLLACHTSEMPVTIDLQGSYARAAGGMTYQTIQTGGTFVELVHDALNATFPSSLELMQIWKGNDPFQYAEHPAASSVAAVIRAETTFLKTQATASVQILKVCEECGIPAGAGYERMPAITSVIQAAVMSAKWNDDETLSDPYTTGLLAKASRKKTLHARNCIPS